MDHFGGFDFLYAFDAVNSRDGDVRNRRLVSLDLGSGNGFPSMVFSLDQGFHTGVELSPGLVANSYSRSNLDVANSTSNLDELTLERLRLSVDVDDLFKYKNHR